MQGGSRYSRWRDSTVFKPTNADDEALTLNPLYMKTIAKILAGLFLLAVIYFIVSDGMMTHFDLSQGIQYAYNLGSIVILIPLGLYFLLGMNEESALS